MRSVESITYHIQYQCYSLAGLKHADKILTQRKQEQVQQMERRQEENAARVLNENGWTVEGDSPLEIRHVNGDFASGQAAHLILFSLLYEMSKSTEQ